MTSLLHGGQSLQCTYARDISCLQDPRLLKRKSALKRLSKYFINNGELNLEEALFFYEKSLKAPLLVLISDSSEKCREDSLVLLKYFSDHVLKEPSNTLKDTCSILVDRLGSRPFKESGEEVRLLALKYLTGLVQMCKSTDVCFNECTQSILEIVAQTLKDTYPEVKKQSGTLFSATVARMPKNYPVPHVVMNNLLENASHQHSRVRAASLNAFANGLKHFFKGIEQYFQQYISPVFRKLQFDKSPTVLVELTAAAKKCFCQEELQESSRCELLELILFVISNNSLDVKNGALSALEYIASNIPHILSNLAHNKDLETPDNCHSEMIAMRNAKCVVEQYLTAMLPNIFSELQSWKQDQRLHAINILSSVVSISPSNLELHLVDIIVFIGKASRDEADFISNLAHSTATKTGEVTQVKSIVECYHKLLLGEIKNCFQENLKLAISREESFENPRKSSSLSLNDYCGVINILPDILRGVNQMSCRMIIAKLTSYLAAHYDIIKDSGTDEYFTILGETMYDFIFFLEEEKLEDADFIRDIITIVFSSIGFSQHPHLIQRMKMLISKLTAVLGMDASADFYDRYFSEIFSLSQGQESNSGNSKLIVTSRAWSKESCERIIFDDLVRGCGGRIYKYIDKIIPCFVLTLQPDNEPDLVISMLALLDTVLRQQWPSESVELYGGMILEELILPNCTWRVGRVASTTRKMSIFCLDALITNRFITRSIIGHSVDQLVSVAKSCLGDEEVMTRKATCTIMEALFRLYPGSFPFSLASDAYPELLKRLDDSNDEVRMSVCQTLSAFFFAPNISFWQGTPLNYTLECLFVHLDDKDSKIQESVYNCLTNASKLNKSLLARMASSRIEHHSNSKYLHVLVKQT